MSRSRPRILIIDDAAVYRRVLADIVTEIPNAVLAGTAPNGSIGLKKLAAEAVDLLLLDIEMPGMNGLEVLHAVRRKHPEIETIIVSGTSRAVTDTAVRAIDLGAFDFVFKPETSGPEESKAELRQSIELLVNAYRAGYPQREAFRARVRPPSRGKVSPAPTQVATLPGTTQQPLGPAMAGRRPTKVVAIGVSSGGPVALMQLVPRLDPELSVPVVVVQHMPPSFTSSLTEQLDRTSSLCVKEAEDGEPLRARTVLFAPGGRHMVVRSVAHELVIGLNDNPPISGFRPSVDVLFRSLAGIRGGGVLGVVMTGMGEDGVDGARALRRVGGYFLAQDESSCVVFGMSRSLIENGLADEVVALDSIASRVNTLATNGLARP